MTSPLRSTWTRKTPCRCRRPPPSTDTPSNAPRGATLIATLNSRTSSLMVRVTVPRSGSSIWASSTTTPVPAKATGRPTGASSNSRNGSMPASRNKPETVRLVDVPIAVTIPPSTAA